MSLTYNEMKYHHKPHVILRPTGEGLPGGPVGADSARFHCQGHEFSPQSDSCLWGAGRGDFFFLSEYLKQGASQVA